MSKPAVSSLEIVRGMRLSIIASVFSSCFSVCIAPQFLNGFALLLGAGPLEIALLTSLPMAGLALQIVFTLLIQQAPRRKPIWFWLASIHRLLWFPIAIIPLLAGWTGKGFSFFLFLFLFLFFISNTLGSMATPPWFSWMADLIPKEQAGKFWGRRVAMFSLVCVVGIPIGWLTDSFPKGDLLPYALLFALAGLLGQIDIMIHNRVVEPPAVPPATGVPYWKLLGEPFLHTDFRRLLLFSCTWNLAVFFADSFVMAFLLEKLLLSQSFIALAVSLMWIMRWGMARYWGFLGDRFGHAVVLKICAAALVIWPLALVFWGYSHPKTSVLMAYLYAGFFNVGFETSFTALMLGLAPGSKKSLYVSVIQACGGLVGTVAPLVGGALLTSLQTFQFKFGQLDNFQFVFLIGTLLRLITVAVFSLRSMEVKTTTTAGMVVRRLIDANPFKVIHHSYVLDEGSVETERVDAVHELAEAASDLATEQLVRALRDPSLEVRRGAVHALAEIGDRSTLPALVEIARCSEAQIQPEVIETIGSFRDHSLTPCLLGWLEDPLLRLPALRGLARQKDPSTRDRLRYWALLDSATPDVRASAFEAWCALEDEECIKPGLQFMIQAPSDLVRWQVAIALGRVTVDPVDFYAVLQEELRVMGGAISSASDVVQEAPFAETRPRHVRRIASALVQHAQSCYMQGQWREATQALVLATFYFQEILPELTTLKSLPAVFSAKDRTDQKISEEVAAVLRRLALSFAESVQKIRTAHPDLTLSLCLLDELRKTATQDDCKTILREKTLLAYCLLRKLLGYETAI